MPVAVEALEITGAAGLTVIVNVLVPVPPALIALMVTVEVATAVVVPLITPLVVFILKPDGKPVAL